MISRYEAWLNNVALSTIDSDIYISDIGYQPIKRKINAAHLAGRPGAFSSGDTLEENKITVSFVLRKYDTEERQTALQSIIKWAVSGGVLRTSDRLHQHIQVKCTSLPAITSALRWLDTLTIEFSAFDFPFWQDDTSTTVTLDSGDEDTIFLQGVYRTTVEATVTAGEGLTEIELQCGETSITLSDIEVGTGDTIVISYTADHHILEIKSGETSLLDHRTGSDDLIAEPGNNTVSFTASGSATCEFRVKGVYM